MTPATPVRALAGSLAFLACATTLHAQPTVFYVDNDAPPGGSGLSWQTAFQNLQGALEIRRAFGLRDIEIRIAEGRYTPDRGSLDRTAAFEIGITGESVTTSSAMVFAIRGGYAGVGHADPNEHDPSRFVTVLSGDLAGDDAPGFLNRDDNSHHVITALERIENNVLLQDLVIEGGNAVEAPDADGGGVLIRPEQGGGGTVTFSRCTIRDNVAENGGGIAINMAFRLRDWPNAVTVSSGSVIGNVARALGGGIYGDQLTARFVSVVGNRAEEGGGVAMVQEPTHWFNFEVQYALFAGNSASNLGGGIKGNNLRARRITVVHNQAPFASALYSLSAGIMWSSVVGEHFGAARAIEIGPGYLELYDSCVAGGLEQIGPGNLGIESEFVTADPRFRDPSGADGDPLTWQDNDYRLTFASPCLDLIRCDNPIIVDVIDLAFAEACVIAAETPCSDPSRMGDMGAYEYQRPACPGDFDGDGVLTSSDLLLYLSAWDRQLPQADLTTPCSTWNSDDFMAALMRYAQGCP